jgi:Raf kinase inhibitor-like YbhB/YbcL family protein
VRSGGSAFWRQWGLLIGSTKPVDKQERRHMSSIKFSIDGIFPNQRIPAKFAMGKADPETHATFSSNVSPSFSWAELPEGTKSLALICRDIDAPSKPDDVNQEGKTVPYELPRADFYHLVLVNIPATCFSIAEGALSSEVTKRGKPCGPAIAGVQGKNDYTGWFAGDGELEGVYGGYDGPFPPWNDERIHRYLFTLYALAVARVPLAGEFDGRQALEAIQPHILNSATIQGTYAIYSGAHP